MKLLPLKMETLYQSLRQILFLQLLVRIRICGLLCRYIFVIIDSGRFVFLIGLKAKDTGGRIICGGVASLVGIQTFINISVTTMIFPNTGLSLPFVSYGLTSIVCFYMGIGFVLNVGLQPNKYQ